MHAYVMGNFLNRGVKRNFPFLITVLLKEKKNLKSVEFRQTYNFKL